MCVTSSSTIEAPEQDLNMELTIGQHNKGVCTIPLLLEVGTRMISTFFVSKLRFEDMMIFIPNVVLRFRLPNPKSSFKEVYVLNQYC